MYKSGQRFTASYDTKPLSLNLDFLNSNYVAPRKNEGESESEQDKNSGGKSKQNVEYDYNYLME